MPLTKLEATLLEEAVKLRTFVRKTDAPKLHEVLNGAAELLVSTQRAIRQNDEDMEKAVQCLEKMAAFDVQIPIEAGNIARRYRMNNPK